MYGDATNWDENAYRETVLKEREIQTRTVFRTAWAPPYNLDTLLAASSDGSVASYSISSSIAASKLKNPFGFVNADTDKLSVEPNCFIQAHYGPAYDVKFYGDGEDALLLSCGDDGRIRGWKWKEFSSPHYSVSSQGGNDTKPVLDVVNPQHKGPWGALSPIPENNALAVNTQEGSVFAASGDSCAYCWDVETGKLKMVFKGHMEYLHCIVARNSSNQVLILDLTVFGLVDVRTMMVAGRQSSPRGNMGGKCVDGKDACPDTSYNALGRCLDDLEVDVGQMITGSEDGTTRIWDCKSGKCTQVIDPVKHLKLKGSASWVGCVALDASESWLACSSGRNISLWNLPASECVSKIPTRATVQDMLFDNNQILTVGTDPLLNRFDMNGTILSQIQCAPSSSFSISLHPAGEQNLFLRRQIYQDRGKVEPGKKTTWRSIQCRNLTNQFDEKKALDAQLNKVVSLLGVGEEAVSGSSEVVALVVAPVQFVFSANRFGVFLLLIDSFDPHNIGGLIPWRIDEDNNKGFQNLRFRPSKTKPLETLTPFRRQTTSLKDKRGASTSTPGSASRRVASAGRGASASIAGRRASASASQAGRRSARDAGAGATSTSVAGGSATMREGGRRASSRVAGQIVGSQASCN
ncbi:hypothetical protein LR48_Vigan07g142500 [Vigna angularis]|uniref:Uncharacterized protein n=1 Tax=Phaseolus angularis TaxID=3914 RepID=A0A0L9UYE8_PHAAN|nr:hypothetical protein LR48_Vigan07g142500 [Vigna angularis]